MKIWYSLKLVILSLIFVILWFFIIWSDWEIKIRIVWLAWILFFWCGFFLWIYSMINEIKLSNKKSYLYKNWVTIKAKVNDIIELSDNQGYLITVIDWKDEYVLKIINFGFIKGCDLSGMTIYRFYGKTPMKLIDNKRYSSSFKYKWSLHDIIPSIFKKWVEIDVIVDPLNHDDYWVFAESLLEKDINWRVWKSIRKNLIKSSMYRDPYKYYIMWRYNSNLEITILFLFVALFFIIFWIMVKNVILILWGVLVLIVYSILMYKKNKLEWLRNLRISWKKIEAEIIEIKSIWKEWCVIKASEWENIYESPVIYNNIKKYVTKWEYIFVFIDSKNSSRYYMDLDSIHTKK